MLQALLTAPRLDALSLVELDPPRPGPGELLLRLKAATLNYRDVAIATGNYPLPQGSLPLVPLSDGAGEVVEVGTGVEGWRSGERAVPHYMPDWIAGRITAAVRGVQLGGPLPGVARQYMLARPHWLARPPAGFSDAEAAALPIAATTAWNALKAGNVGPGSTVLVLGTGGVAMFALQLAKAAGAWVLVASSSAERLDRARMLGADAGIDYRATPDWDVEARRLTDGRGVDLVVEVGGEGTLARSMRAVAHGGTVSLIGFLAGASPTLPLFDALVKGVRLQGIATGSRADLEEAALVLARHRSHPVIDRVVPLVELRAALGAMGAGGHFGKLAVDLT